VVAEVLHKVKLAEHMRWSSRRWRKSGSRWHRAPVQRCYRAITSIGALEKMLPIDLFCLLTLLLLPIDLMIVRTSIELGNALRARRRELGLAQEEISGVIGVNRRVIGELERGKGTVQLQIAMEAARALGLDIELAPRRK
jgi:DNA-binding XRE family transcriptional regulator